MRKYACDTTVCVQKSINDIQKILTQFGATRFGYMSSETDVIFACELRNKRIKFKLPLPLKKDVPYHPQRNSDKYLEQQFRSLHRGLFLTIKAKLVSIDSGIETFEEAFLANIILSNGQSFGEYSIPKLEETYNSGDVPRLTFH